MAMTPSSSATPYCSAAEFFDFYTQPLAADMLKSDPDGPRPSYLAMLDSTNPAGAKLLNALRRGAGEIESVCQIAARYTAADLLALDGMSAVLLKGLNAARAMWSIYQRLKPGSAKPEDVPGAKESFELLKDLRDGAKVFSYEEVQDAGLPSVQPPSPQNLQTPNVVGRAYRLFPGYGLNSRIWGNY